MINNGLNEVDDLSTIYIYPLGLTDVAGRVTPQSSFATSVIDPSSNTVDVVFKIKL